MPELLVKACGMVTLLAMVVGVKGDVPKLFVPPGIPLKSHPTINDGVGVTNIDCFAALLPQALVTV